VAEARLQGLLPFCLTVDREAPAYLPAIFGPRGFAVLSRPERLPTVLVEVIRSLVTA
jgi:nitric oxide reductase NorD protein